MARKEALSLEKQARQKSIASKYRHKNVSPYIEEVSRLYEKAGDEWIKQAKLKENFRDIKNSLSYAVHDYILANKKAYTDEEKERIKKKINSVSLKLGNQPITGLQKKLSFATVSIISLISALFFVSFSLTGNSILGIVPNDSQWIGLCFFACGLIFAFFYFKKKNKDN